MLGAELCRAHRRRQIPPLIRVEHDGDVASHRLPDPADSLGIRLGAQSSDLDLDRAISLLHVHGRLANEIVGALAVPIVEARDIGGHPLPEGAAQQCPDGAIDRLALEIPQGDVDGAHGRDQGALLPRERGNPAHARVREREQVLPDPLGVEWILPHHERRDGGQDVLHGAQAVRALLEEERPVGLADSHVAGIRGEPDDDLAHARDPMGGRADGLGQGRGQEVRLERGDLHRATPSRTGRAAGRGCTGAA